MSEWFEEFFDGLYGKVMPTVFDDAQSQEQAMAVKRLLKLRKGDRVLDIPCGMGRLAIPLAKKGCNVSGIDLMRPYISRAKKGALKEGVNIEFTTGDMRQIDFDNEFDFAVNWFGSFGYFSDEENLDFCKRILKALKPGGRFLVETMNKSWLLFHFRTHGVQTIGGVEIEKEHRWNKRTSRVEATWTFRKDGVIESRKMNVKVFNGTEIRSLFRSAGFQDIKLFPSPPTGRFTRHSIRMIAIAKKPS